MSEQNKKDIFAIVLGILFMLTGIPKLLGVQGAVDNFNNWQLGDSWRYAVGVTELILGVLMFSSPTKKYAAFIYFCLMQAAIMVHITVKEYVLVALPVIFAGLAFTYLLKRGVLKFN